MTGWPLFWLIIIGAVVGAVLWAWISEVIENWDDRG